MNYDIRRNCVYEVKSNKTTNKVIVEEKVTAAEALIDIKFISRSGIRYWQILNLIKMKQEYH